MEWYIKLHRQLLNWEWYNDTNTKVLFIHLLLRANHADWRRKWQNIKRGQLITWLKSLSNDLWLSVQQIRTSIKKLKSTNEITVHSTSLNSLIELINYDWYQDNNKQPNKRATKEQHTSNNKQEWEEWKEWKENNTDECFKIFWKEYPLKKSKEDAKKKFYKLIENDEKLFDIIIKAIESQKKERELLKIAQIFVPEWKHPSTWLNQWCRKDEVRKISLSPIDQYIKDCKNPEELDRLRKRHFESHWKEATFKEIEQLAKTYNLN